VADVHVGAQGLSRRSRRSGDCPGQVATCDDVLYLVKAPSNALRSDTLPMCRCSIVDRRCGTTHHRELLGKGLCPLPARQCLNLGCVPTFITNGLHGNESPVSRAIFDFYVDSYRHHPASREKPEHPQPESRSDDEVEGAPVLRLKTTSSILNPLNDKRQNGLRSSVRRPRISLSSRTGKIRHRPPAYAQRQYRFSQSPSSDAHVPTSAGTQVHVPGASQAEAFKRYSRCRTR
jgi:hypothetical protein